MSLTRRYVAVPALRGRRHHAGLNCITVALNGDSQAIPGAGEGTVGSKKSIGPGAGEEGKQERREALFHLSRVVRACSRSGDCTT